MDINILTEKADVGLEQFVKEFHTDRLIEIKELSVYLNESRFKEICFVAHKWKGFSRPYGFVGLALLSEELEITSKYENFEQTEEFIKKIEIYLADKGKYLN